MDLLPAELFLPLLRQTLFIFENVRFEAFLLMDKFLVHTQVVSRVIFVQLLNLLQELRLLLNLRDVVDGLVKDRNMLVAGLLVCFSPRNVTLYAGLQNVHHLNKHTLSRLGQHRTLLPFELGAAVA